MGLPSTAITRTDLSMSFQEFSAALNRRKFIGHQVFPPLSVNVQSETFRVMPIEAFLMAIEDTKRAPKAGYNRDDFTWATDSYACEEHGVEEVTDDRQVKMYGEVPAEAIARERALNRIAQRYEYDCAAAAFDGTYFSGAYTAALSTPWSTAASADPIADIDAAREAFVNNCGVTPNALVLEQKALIACLRTARIEGVVKYTSGLDALTARRLVPQLEDVFQLRLIVAESPVKNTAARGKDPVFGRIWAQDKALVCRISDSPDIEQPEPFLGRTIMWSEEAGPLPGADGEGMGVLVEEYREENRRGGVIRARTDYAIKRFYKPAGYLLTNVT